MNIIITEHLDELCAQWLSERADVSRIAYDDPAFYAALAEAEGLVIRTYTIVDQAFLDQAPKLKVVGRAGVGLDNVDLEACAKRGVKVVYTPDANTQAVVEYVTGLMLDHHRPRTALTRENLAGFHTLRKTEVGQELATMTFGTWGMGRIGKRIGYVAAAMGMRVLGHDLLPASDWQKDLPYDCACVDLPTLLSESDILTLHVDGRASNKHVVNAEALKQMKKTALFINAARGVLVDHAAMNQWLIDCPDAFAVLDVHDPEPPSPELPLFDRPNAKLLPHLASRTPVAMQNMSWVVKDVLAVLQGHEPKCPAN